MANSSSVLTSKLDKRLSLHLEGISLNELSRIDETRLTSRALPHIGMIELVSADNFSQLYDAMYISMFPHSPERERSDLIVDRIRDDFEGKRDGLAPYRIVGIRAHDGSAIGAAQFSVLMLKDNKNVVPFLQYLYVRSQNRRQDMAEVLHTMILAVATADAKRAGDRTVPFTLLETEPAGYGSDNLARQISTQRIQIHTRGGAVGLMLKRSEGENHTLHSPHCQPGLEVGEPPLSLLWAIRKSPASQTEQDIVKLGPLLVVAFYQSLRNEGFPEQNIRLAEKIVEERCIGMEYITMSLTDAVIQPVTEKERQMAT